MQKGNRTIAKYIIAAVIILLLIFSIYRSNNFSHYGDRIRLSFDGIKYRSRYDESYTVAKIELNGILKNEGIGHIFEGDIIIDGEPSSRKEYWFDENHMTILRTDSIRGMFYAGEKMEEITIEIFEPDDKGNYIINDDGGWVISAPCKTREEAVSITNKLKYQNDW